jgi:hypothetical protein
VYPSAFIRRGRETDKEKRTPFPDAPIRDLQQRQSLEKNKRRKETLLQFRELVNERRFERRFEARVGREGDEGRLGRPLGYVKEVMVNREPCCRIPTKISVGGMPIGVESTIRPCNLDTDSVGVVLIGSFKP